MTLYPLPQTFKLWQFDSFEIFFPKCPNHKKIQKKKKLMGKKPAKKKM
jgi:hypothetical protein